MKRKKVYKLVRISAKEYWDNPPTPKYDVYTKKGRRYLYKTAYSKCKRAKGGRT